MFISYIALSIGIVVAFCLYMFGGRLAGLSATALWSIGTAYFVMPPSYSLRVSNQRDWAALALFGAVGLVIARFKPLVAAALKGSGQEGHKVQHQPLGLVNIKEVLTDLTASSDLGQRLRHMGIEVDVSGLQTFPCSYADAVSVLSHVLAAILIEPQLRRISVQTARRPEAALLFVWAHNAWPPPLKKTIDIGRCAENSSKAEYSSWPTYMSATWFDNGCGHIYQISRRLGTSIT